MKRMWILLFALAAVTVLMVACGRNRNDADTNSVQQTEQRTEQQETDRETEEERRTETTDDAGIMDDAGDIVSDVIEGGEDVVSDVAEGGREIASGIAGTDDTTEETASDTSR